MSDVLPKTPIQLILFISIFAGAIVPWYFNLQFMEIYPSFDLKEFVSQGFVNPAAASLSTDLCVSAFVGICFMVSESQRLKMKFLGVYLFLACIVSFACSFPLFLYVREKVISKTVDKSS